MSRSAGPGSPIFFMCARLRKVYWRDRTDRLHANHRVVRTGRTRPAPRNPGHAVGVRSLMVEHEYRCSCGYVGWTRHIDILTRRIGSGEAVR